MAVIKTVFKFRRANSQEWNPNFLLEAGEPGFELDTGKLKIGNGKKKWSELDYIQGSASITTGGALEIISGQNLQIDIAGFQNAGANTIPVKQLGALTWLNKNDLIDNALENSDNLNSWIEGKIEAVTSRVYRGEAGLVTIENNTITVFDSNYDEINDASIGDIYSYVDNETTKRYLWTGEEWVEVSGQEVYATKANVLAIDNKVENLASRIGSTITLGLVKSSNDTNKIKIENDGTMSMNQIKTSQLVNDANSELILNAGNATL